MGRMQTVNRMGICTSSLFSIPPRLQLEVHYICSNKALNKTGLPRKHLGCFSNNECTSVEKTGGCVNRKVHSSCFEMQSLKSVGFRQRFNFTLPNTSPMVWANRLQSRFSNTQTILAK